jgi:hypothetical protein
MQYFKHSSYSHNFIKTACEKCAKCGNAISTIDAGCEPKNPEEYGFVSRKGVFESVDR